MLSKYKLYQSEYKKSNVASSIFKMSTFSIDVDDHKNYDVNVRNSLTGFNNPFLNKIDFAQSKVLDNDFDFNNLKKSQLLTVPSKKGINPFEEITDKNSPF